MCVQCVIFGLLGGRRDEGGLTPLDHLRMARVERPAPRTPLGKVMRGGSWLVKRVLYVPLFVYKYGISPFLPKLCRYYPSCSVFMMQAIEQKGPLWGLCLGTFRLLSCNPFGGSGFDPVENYPPYWTDRRWVWRRHTFEREWAECQAAETSGATEAGTSDGDGHGNGTDDGDRDVVAPRENERTGAPSSR